jgi:hypothetical protein
MKRVEAKRDRKHRKREHFMLGAYLSIYGKTDNEAQVRHHSQKRQSDRTRPVAVACL